MAKRYEESFKEEIVKQYQSGNSAVELCALNQEENQQL